MESLDAQIKKYTEQLASDPRSRAFVPLSETYRKLGRYDEAIAVAAEGLKHHPHYVSGKLALARAHFENGDVNSAQGILEEVARLTPDNLLANRILSEIYVQKGEPGRAEPLLRQLLVAEPHDERAREQLRRIEEGKGEAAKPPTVKTATLAEVYREQGHSVEALKVYKEVAQKEPDNPVVAEKIAEVAQQVASGPFVGQEDRLNELLERIQEKRRKSA